MNDRDDPRHDDPHLPRGTKWHGRPYDFSRLTWARGKSSWFNPEDLRMFTPTALGAGWTVNFYWLVHPGATCVTARAELGD
jgi:hypothetical protein